MLSATLSNSPAEPGWTVQPLFVSALMRVTALACRPQTLGCSCEKCAADHQLVLLRQGGFIKHVRGERFVANANKAVFFKAQEPYRATHFDPAGDTSVVISIGDALLEDAAGADSSRIPSHFAVSREGARAARALVARLEAGACALEVEEAGVAVLRAAFRPAVHAPRRVSKAARAVVQDVEALLTHGYAASWSLARLARRAGGSPYHLAQTFRSVTGLPIHRYLMNLRLAAALRRLGDGECNIAALAVELGFSSHAHFSTAFKAAYGIPPSAARMRKNLKAAAAPRR